MIAKEEAQKRQDTFQRACGELAHERLSLTRRIEEIDKQLIALEGASEANSLALKDMDTEAAIAAAKAAEEVADNKETQDD